MAKKNKKPVQVTKSGSWAVFWIWFALGFLTGIGFIIAFFYWLFKLRETKTYKN